MTAMSKDNPAPQRNTARPQPQLAAPPPADEVRVVVPFVSTRAFAFHYVRLPLDVKQGRALRVVHDSLLQRGAKLEDGHMVDGANDTVRWLIEQVAKGVPTNILQAG